MAIIDSRVPYDGRIRNTWLLGQDELVERESAAAEATWNTNHITLHSTMLGGRLGGFGWHDDYNNWLKNKTKEFDVRITKTKMLDGWLVQTYLTVNGTEHMVAESQYEEEENNDPIAQETGDILSALRRLFQ